MLNTYIVLNIFVETVIHLSGFFDEYKVKKEHHADFINRFFCNILNAFTVILY